MVDKKLGAAGLSAGEPGDRVPVASVIVLALTADIEHLQANWFSGQTGFAAVTANR